MKNVPVIFGEVLFDCFEDGSRVLGGAPFNVAWHLQAFGCSPLFISRVGDDPMARQIRSTMQQWGMTTAGLQLDSAHPTGEVKVSLKNGQPTYDIVINRAYDYIEADSLPPLSPSLVYHGTLGLRQPESASVLETILEQYSMPVFMDVNLRPPWWNKAQAAQLLDQAQWVKINDEELNILTDSSEDLPEQAENLLKTHHLELVVVTLGKDGAFILDNQGAFTETAPLPDIPVIDTVGAGDAFASVCIIGLLYNWPHDLIVQRAQEFASVLVGQRGATISDHNVYQAFANKWQMTKDQ
ncbi:MAG: carbohydrate kinase [Gammaproteobacteria bacterium]|nr:MAG: carbohydrate kinase [Gammaproteobacteria bacterium]